MSREWWRQPGNRSEIGDETRVVRPALADNRERIQLLTRGTYTDSANAGTNFANAATLTTKSDHTDTTYGNLMRIYFFLITPISLPNLSHVSLFSNFDMAYQENGLAAGGAFNFTGQGALDFITDWGGLDETTITWTNQGGITVVLGNYGATTRPSVTVSGTQPTGTASANSGRNVGIHVRNSSGAAITVLGIRLSLNHDHIIGPAGTDGTTTGTITKVVYLGTSCYGMLMDLVV